MYATLLITKITFFFFFVKYKYNIWVQFSKYVQYLTKYYEFDVSLEKVIFQWNINNLNLNFVNILIEETSCAVYKSQIIVTQKMLSVLDIKKTDKIIAISKKKIHKSQRCKARLDSCNVNWNMK